LDNKTVHLSKVKRKDNALYPYSRGTKGGTITIIVFALMMTGCSNKDNSTGPSDMTNIATIYLDNSQQVIRGFGGVNMPGWTSVGDLTAGQVQEAFGTGPGQIGLSILRIRVPYDTVDFKLEVPTARLVKSLGVSTIFASPWSPPPSMKSNNNIVEGILNANSYADYANYLKAFANYMSSNGAPLYAISVQNEPDAAVTYESCSWNASQLLNFVKTNASAIGTSVIVPESENFNHSLSDPILNDPAAAANVSIIGGHIYGGGLTSYPLAASKGKEVWMTEHLVLDTNWVDALGTAKEINDCMNAGMNAYVWWYIRRYYGLIDENSNITKRGYVMSQYARFVRPGYNMVAATASPQTNIDISAYKNGSKFVMIVLNRNSSSTSQKFIIQNGAVNTFTPYVTSSTQNCTQRNDITVSSGSFTVTLDPLSVTTFVSN
jgi:glucuronoarabinoxylan endo-1,4-beta-xylanase